MRVPHFTKRMSLQGTWVRRTGQQDNMQTVAVSAFSVPHTRLKRGMKGNSEGRGGVGGGDLGNFRSQGRSQKLMVLGPCVH